MRRLKILIAEDETIIRLDLRAMLEAAGHEVCAEARNGQDAVELADSREPDLAILDVKMPLLDGVEAARRILDRRPLPIIMLTAYGDDQLVERAVEAGVYGYVVKPFREDDLLPAIATAFARHRDATSSGDEAGLRGVSFEVHLPTSRGGGRWPLTFTRDAGGGLRVTRNEDEGDSPA